jgi:hypothetical protein
MIDPGYRAVAEIDGAEVALGEFSMFFEDAKAEARRKFGMEDWEAEERPLDYAIRVALEELLPYKLVQMELLDRGAIGDISFKGFVNEWENENLSRMDKKARGEIYYGPDRYGMRSYYEYLDDERREALSSLMREEATDEDLRKIYDENPELFFWFGTVQLKCLALPMEGYTREEAMDIREKLRESSGFASAAEELGVSEYLFDREIGAEDLNSADIRLYPEVLEAVIGFEAGGMSEVIENEGVEWLVLYCESRTGGGRKSFSECKSELLEMYQEMKFSERLQERVQKAVIVVNDEAKRLIGGLGE